MAEGSGGIIRVNSVPGKVDLAEAAARQVAVRVGQAEADRRVRGKWWGVWISEPQR